MPLSFTSRGRWLAFIAGGLMALGLVLLPWWRNHHLLRDFCDYGLVMAAVGRIGLGERPYVDFVTPIQTLQFTLGSLAEGWWGARYLSLTYANAAFIAATFLGLTWVLVRPMGRTLAVLMAAAIVTASSTQHTIIWYNAVGVTWLAGVIALTARPPGVGRGRWLRLTAVFAMLWLGGMTKLTYQAAALAFAILFTLRFACNGTISRKHAVGLVAGFMACGTVLPLVTERVYTGATFAQWAYSVIELPSARTGLLKLTLLPTAYWHTPHDYYRPMYFPFVGLWGVVLLIAVGLMCGRRVWQMKGGRGREIAFLAVSLVGAWICGAVLLATNYEIAYVSGAAWLALATAIAIAFAPDDPGGLTRGFRWVLAGAALSLMVPSWISAWTGARALWGIAGGERNDLVSADDLPDQLAYLKGMRIAAAMHGSLEGFPARVETWTKEGISPSSYYFINASEWMVRVLPEARHRGLPLWLFRETTITDKEIKQIDDKLRRGSDIKVIVEDDAWDVAYPGIEQILNERYEHSRLGPVLHLHRLQMELASDVLGHPLEFAVNLDSNMWSGGMTLVTGSLELRSRDDGRYLCSPHSSQIDVGFGVHTLSGEMIAEMLPHGGAESVPVTFRLRRKTAGRAGPVVLDRTVSLTADQRSIVLRFTIDGGGDQLSLEIVLPPGAPAEAGWRSLRMDRAGSIDPGKLFPLTQGLSAQTPDAAWPGALFAADAGPPKQLAAFGMDNHPDRRDGVPELFSHVPGEIWFEVDDAVTRVSGQFGLRESAWKNPGALPGMKAWVIHAKGGRFEILFQKELRTGREEDRGVQSFDVALPEPGGWVGLVMTPLDPSNISFGHTWWRGVEAK